MSEASTFTGVATAPAGVNATLDAGVSNDVSMPAGKTSSDLLYTYEDEAKRPYMADYLNIQNIWDKEPVLKSEVQLLENYLRKMVVDKKIDNNTSAAKKYVEWLENKAGIESFDRATVKISKLLKYIDFREVVDS